MADENKPEDETKDPITPVDDDKEPKEPKQEDKPKEPADDLAPIKESLNKAYSERDAAKAEVERLKKEARDKEIEQLTKDGKEKEALEAKLSDRDSEIDSLKQTIVELTRDNAVQKELGALEFRNERARDLAYDTVVKSLVQNKDGKWVSKDGKPISDAVASFAEDEENKFLFKEKENRGTETAKTTTTSPKAPSSGNKLRDRTQAEVLQMAAEGKLPG